jgi:redox-sensitive bicupin YhaK (pirin superfamily)
MSGFVPFFNKRRTFLKQTLGMTALYLLNPLKSLGAHTLEKPSNANKMIQLLKKSEQFNDVIFGGRFHANKPVYNGQNNVKPYSNLFYWSNGYVNEACEFGLHPHEGFEIMTFIFDGTIEHYDTATRIWTPLHAGDFQIIQSNSGIRHQEKVTKGSRAFQIWFDPNYQEAMKQNPSYIDYHAADFQPINQDGILTTTYVGDNSQAKALTPGLKIKKLTITERLKTSLSLNENSCYTCYVLNGQGMIEGNHVEQDDALRLFNASAMEIDFQGELFCIETPIQLDYKPVWL